MPSCLCSKKRLVELRMRLERITPSPTDERASGRRCHLDRACRMQGSYKTAGPSRPTSNPLTLQAPAAQSSGSRKQKTVEVIARGATAASVRHVTRRPCMILAIG
jgi:hypothetical protein